MRHDFLCGLLLLWGTGVGFLGPVAQAQGQEVERPVTGTGKPRTSRDAEAPWRPFLWLPPAERPDPDSLHWRADWERAQLEAAARNCPILVLVATDFVPGLATAWQEIIGTDEFAELAEGVVLVAACGGDGFATHWREEERKSRSRADADRSDGEKTLICDRFQIPDSARRALFKRFFKQFVSAEFWQPLYLILGPDGKELARLEGHELKFAHVAGAIAYEQKELGRSVSRKKYERWVKGLNDLIDEQGQKPRRLLQTLARQSKGWESPGMQAVADRIREDVFEQALRAAADAAASHAAGDRAALETLEALEREFEGFEIEDRLREIREGGGGQARTDSSCGSTAFWPLPCDSRGAQVGAGPTS